MLSWSVLLTGSVWGLRMADFESERRKHLCAAWAWAKASGERARGDGPLCPAPQDSRVVRDVLWGLMVGSHSK